MLLIPFSWLRFMKLTTEEMTTFFTGKVIEIWLFFEGFKELHGMLKDIMLNPMIIGDIEVNAAIMKNNPSIAASE